MNDKPKRRWQFSLRAFVLACVAAGVVGGVAGPRVVDYVKARQRVAKQEEFVKAWKKAVAALNGMETEDVVISIPSRKEWEEMRKSVSP